MAMMKVRKLKKDLQAAGFNDAEVKKVEYVIRNNLPPKTYSNAVHYLGLATLIMALGGLILAGSRDSVPEALWVALGAGIGGLAGIFTGSN